MSDIATLNGVEDEDLILTGDVLIGILDKEVTSESTASASATSSNTQNKPSSTDSEDVDAPTNNNEEAASNEAEEESERPVVGGKTKEELDDESSESDESNSSDKTTEDGEKPSNPDESGDESNNDDSEDGDTETPETEEPNGDNSEEPNESETEDPNESADESSDDEEPNLLGEEVEIPEEDGESSEDEEPGISDEELPNESVIENEPDKNAPIGEDPNESEDESNDEGDPGDDETESNADDDETEEDDIVVSELVEILPIDFTTETRENVDLLEGETRVVQEGKKGVETITYEVTVVNGEETNRVEASRVVTTQPVNEIIEIGTNVKYQEPTSTTTEHTYGETEIHNGVYDEVNVGAHGELARAGGYYQTGRLEFLDEEVISYIDANGDFIEVVTTHQRGYFSYGSDIYYDNTIEKWTEVVTEPGQDGYKEFGYTDVYKNGVYQTTIGHYDHGTVVDATVGTILEGTKEIVGSRSWTEITPIYAGTITTNDPNIPASEIYTVAGKDGYIAINYQSVDGGPAVEVSREVVDAVYHEVYNGTK